jgi:hypothetical protein
VIPSAFSQTGSTVNVTGTSGADNIQVAFTADSSQVVIEFNGVAEAYSTTVVNTVAINGVSGADTLIVDSEPIAAATATLTAATLSVVSSDFTISSTNTPNIFFYAKASDTANLTDPAGSNTLIVTPGYEQFVGPGFALTAIGAGHTNGYSNGDDTVRVQAATAAAFIANPNSGYLRAQPRSARGISTFPRSWRAILPARSLRRSRATAAAPSSTR